jgi:hypothetical protein
MVQTKCRTLPVLQCSFKHREFSRNVHFLFNIHLKEKIMFIFVPYNGTFTVVHIKMYVKSLFGAQSADTITVFTIFLRSNNKMQGRGAHPAPPLPLRGAGV